jgi:twitching motility protein PilT
MKYSSNPDNFKLRVMGIQSTLDIAMEEMEKQMSKVERAEGGTEEEGR